VKQNNYIYSFRCCVLIFISVLYSNITLAGNINIIPDVKLKPKKHYYQKNNNLASSVITDSEIARSSVANLGQLLKQKQSVVRLTSSSGDSSQTALSLRGFGDNAVANSLILIDGFPLVNPSLLAPNFNSIPLSDIDHIEIFQGSAGSLYGDQAVGGVVNIITKHPKKFLLNSIVSVGSYNSNYENILIGNKFNNGVFYKLFAVINKTDNYRVHNLQQANNLFGQIGRDYSNGAVNLNFQSYGDKIYFPGGLSASQFKKNPRQATEFNNYSRYRTNDFQLFNKQVLNNNWIFENRLQSRATNGNGIVYIKFNRNDSFININPRLLGTINNNRIIIGYNGQLSDYQLLNSKIETKAHAQQNDLYFQATMPIKKQIDFIFGARKAWQKDRVESVIGHPVNKLNQVFVTGEGIVFHPTEELSFFIRRDENFSFPKADEAAWVPDNVKSLKLQNGVSYEIGSKWTTEKLKAQVTVYRLNLNNEIAFNPSQTIDQPFGAYNNLDKTERTGLTLTDQYQLTKKIKINGQINFVSAKFVSGEFSGNNIPAVPSINGNLGLSYNWSDQLVTEYNLLYTGSRYASQDLRNIGSTIPAYWLSDVYIQYLIKSFVLSFEVHNLFNKKYVSYAYFNSYNEQNTYYPAAGINYQFTVKMNIN